MRNRSLCLGEKPPPRHSPRHTPKLDALEALPLRHTMGQGTGLEAAPGTSGASTEASLSPSTGKDCEREYIHLHTPMYGLHNARIHAHTHMHIFIK